MTLWKKIKLIAGGLLAGLLLILGINWRKRNKITNYDDGELDDLKQDHEDKVEGIKDKVNNKPLEEKLEEMNEKAKDDTSPWAGVNVIIPDNFRATKS